MTAAERELRTFRAFAEHGPLKIVPDSIQSTDAPDILCDLVGGERIAFELVELIDKGYAQDLDTLYKTRRLLEELPQRLPQDLRRSLEERLGSGAFISFQFAVGSPLRDREGAAMDALRWLVERAEPIEDQNSVEGTLRSRMRAVYVDRWELELRFESTSYVRIADPTLDRLRDKFAMAYSKEHPIELLMYTEVDLLYPESTWRPTIEPFVHENLAASPFRRVVIQGGQRHRRIHLSVALTQASWAA